MTRNLKLTPLTELTAEVVNELVIHSTRSSIRRAAAVKPSITIPAGEKVPALTYIEELNPETGEVTWSIHALSVDVTKFLMLQTLNTTTEEIPSEGENPVVD